MQCLCHRLQNENEVPWGVNRRRVVTIKDGEADERSLSVACMHCADAPCAASLSDRLFPPPKMVWYCTTRTSASVVATASRMPFGAAVPQGAGAFASRGKMDKCTFCAGGRKKPAVPGAPVCAGPTAWRKAAAAVCRDVLDQGAARR